MLTLVAATVVTTLKTGGPMTNTNYHIAFDRMMAAAHFRRRCRLPAPPAPSGATTAGSRSLNFQKPWQNRDIKVADVTYEVGLGTHRAGTLRDL